MPLIARIDDLESAEVQSLVAEHLRGMHDASPPETVYALSTSGLKQPDVTFWSVWDGRDLLGCGALKELDANSGEVKSMRTRASFLRRGVGQFMLDVIVHAASARGYDQLLLETGTGEAFEAAHALYRKNGFEWCGPFGDYVVTDFNVFMVRKLK